MAIHPQAQGQLSQSLGHRRHRQQCPKFTRIGMSVAFFFPSSSKGDRKNKLRTRASLSGSMVWLSISVGLFSSSSSVRLTHMVYQLQVTVRSKRNSWSGPSGQVRPVGGGEEGKCEGTERTRSRMGYGLYRSTPPTRRWSVDRSLYDRGGYKGGRCASNLNRGPPDVAVSNISTVWHFYRSKLCPRAVVTSGKWQVHCNTRFLR